MLDLPPHAVAAQTFGSKRLIWNKRSAMPWFKRSRQDDDKKVGGSFRSKSGSLSPSEKSPQEKSKEADAEEAKRR